MCGPFSFYSSVFALFFCLLEGCQWVFDFERLNEEVCDGGEDSISGPKADGEGQTVVVICTAGSVLAEAYSAEEGAGKEG